MNRTRHGGKNIMLKKSLVNGFAMQALVVVVVLGTTTPARASQIFEFSYSLPGAGATPMAVSASGFFATTDLVGNSYTITGAWGTWNGAAITGVLAPGGFGNDNLLFSSGPLLDFNGVGFMVNAPGDSGTGSVNVYYDGVGYTENSTNVGDGPTFSISAATPSPVYFAFNYSIPGAGLTPMNVSASGILTAFNTDANSYLVSGISGSWNGASILSLLSPGTFDRAGIIEVCPAGDKEKDVSGRQWEQRLEVMRDAMIYFRNNPSIPLSEGGHNSISPEHLQQMVDLRKQW